jgi:outer membrane protein OmpA-like peptidoglycan-associated protein
MKRESDDSMPAVTTRHAESRPGGRAPNVQCGAPSRSVVTAGPSKLACFQTALGNQGIQKRLQRGVLQTKLMVNPPGDIYEQEASRIADAVMGMSAPGLPVKPSTSVHRKCACSGSGTKCDECKAKAATLLGSASATAPPVTAPPSVYQALGPGKPLDPAIRSFMDPRFGRDFGDVRIHADASAAASANAVNARAYTIGPDIVFGDRQYAPQTSEGRKLLAHELAHVVQQSDSSYAGPALQRAVQEQEFPGGAACKTCARVSICSGIFRLGSALRAEHKAQRPRIATEIKAALARDPNAKIDIEGQASLTGAAAKNDVLSQQRAGFVRNALAAAGVNSASMNVIAAGSAKSFSDLSQVNLARSRAVRVILPAYLVGPAPRPPGPQPQPQPGTCQGQLPTGITMDGGPVTRNREGNSNFIKLQAGDGTEKNLGMLVSVGNAISPQNCGDLVFVQNVQPFRQIIYKDRTRNTFMNSGFVLDTSDPYPSQVFGNPPVTVSAANDSPSHPILFLAEPIIQTVEARDDFRMFVLFQPKGGSRTVLQVAEWSWIGQFKSSKPINDLENGILVLDTSVSRVTPQHGKGTPTSDTPVFSPNVTSLNWVTDNAGDTSGNSFVDLDRKVLDKTKPRAETH